MMEILAPAPQKQCIAFPAAIGLTGHPEANNIGVFKPRAGEEESSMIPSYLMRIVIIEINMIEHEVPDYC